MIANTLFRPVRRAFPGRNPLATAGDRIEGAVLALGVVMALLAIPVAAAVGSEIYATRQSRVAVEQKSRVHVDAVLVEDAPSLDGAPSSEALVETTEGTATWRMPDGDVRKGVARAPYGAEAGTVLRIWADLSGEPTEPPLTDQGAAFTAMFSAVLLWGLTAGAMALLFGLVRLVHMKARLRWWQLEWELTAPDWTGR